MAGDDFKKGNIPVPVHLIFILQDGSKIVSDQTAMVWKDGKQEVVVEKEIQGTLKSVELGSPYIPDVSYTDNRRDAR
jgi:hypothetical protein